MKIEEIDINKIKPYPNNPRVNDGSVDLLVKSIREYGFDQPLVLDKDMVVIVGHTRLKAAMKLKMKTVPCLIASDWSKKKAAGYRLLDNKVGDYSIWDNKKLLKELDELDGVLTGFEKSDNFDDVLDESDNMPVQENEDGIFYTINFKTQNKEVMEKVKEFIESVSDVEQ